jgi:hypothetical protein
MFQHRELPYEIKLLEYDSCSGSGMPEGAAVSPASSPKEGNAFN